MLGTLVNLPNASIRYLSHLHPQITPEMLRYPSPVRSILLCRRTRHHNRSNHHTPPRNHSLERANNPPTTLDRNLHLRRPHRRLHLLRPPPLIPPPPILLTRHLLERRNLAKLDTVSPTPSSALPISAPKYPWPSRANPPPRKQNRPNPLPNHSLHPLPPALPLLPGIRPPRLQYAHPPQQNLRRRLRQQQRQLPRKLLRPSLFRFRRPSRPHRLIQEAKNPNPRRRRTQEQEWAERQGHGAERLGRKQ